MILTRMLLLTPLLLSAVLLTADARLAADYETEEDIVFGAGGDTQLKLDLYRPTKGEGPFPAVVCVHGGSWRSGDYKVFYIREIARLLAKNGYVAASVQYRLVPKATFPAQIEDVKCSVRWLRANAEKYNIDSKHIGAVGFSAGGHLACLLGLTNRTDGLEGTGGCDDFSSEVQAVVDYFGPVDLRKGDYPGRTTLKDLVGGTVQENPEGYAKASPITYIDRNKKMPPFLMIHGTRDTLVKHEQSERMRDALLEAGGNAKLVSIKGGGHGLWTASMMQLAKDETVKFFDKHLKGKQP